MLRKFLREFPRYKQQAEAGKKIELVDRNGKRFVFVAEKQKRSQGAARHLWAGKALSPDPIPREEWGENY